MAYFFFALAFGVGWLMYRDNVVLKYRIYVILESDPDPLKRMTRYNSLPSYEIMVFQLHRWDWSDYWKGLENGEASAQNTN